MARSIAENEFWTNYGYHRGEVVLKNRPQISAIESTNYCNLKCIMCPRGEPDLMKRPLGTMDSALFQKILDSADFFSEPCWFHWFGEPLMNPQLFSQIQMAKTKVPNLGISTNATLLSEKNAEQILNSDLDTIIIAVDGVTKEIYERVRKGSFTYELVRENVERFLRMRKSAGLTRPHTILSIIAMDETQPDLEQFRQHWQQHGADKVLFKPFVTWGGQDDYFVDLAMADNRASFASPRKHACKNLWQSLVIAWDGRVVPCCFDYNTRQVMGDLKVSTLEEIWNGPEYVALRKAELAGENRCALCANCAQAPGHERNAGWGRGSEFLKLESISSKSAA